MRWRKEAQGHERTWVCTQVKELVFCSCKDAEIASIKQSTRLTATWTYLAFEWSLPAVFLLNRDSISKNDILYLILHSVNFSEWWYFLKSSQCFPEILIYLVLGANKESPLQVPDGGMARVRTCPNQHGAEGRAQSQLKNKWTTFLLLSGFPLCTAELLTLTNTNG